MYYKFLKYIEQNHLFLPNEKILLAVSGGKDSMVMTDLFQKAKFNIGIAHFNHSTRAGESDLDEAFVKEFCARNSLQFFSTKVDIEALLNTGEGNNFQDIARKYRYQWLEKIRNTQGYDYIATAHHKDDNIETFLYKISRGSGLSGLNGINIKTGKIIRPILNISRQEIDLYVAQNKIDFREDSSNKSDKYSRNFIRHNIIPQFKKFNKNFEQGIAVTMQNIQSANKTLDFLVDNFFRDYIEYTNKWIIIQKKILVKLIENKDLIYYLFSRYKFNFSQVLDILKSLDNTGAKFYNPDYELLIDRKNILIRRKKNPVTSVFEIVPGLNKIEDEGLLKIEKSDLPEAIDQKNCLYLNADKINFPLKLRKWQAGDKFKPFGLKGKNKKLKHFFADKKLSLFEKDDVFVLLNNDDLCAVIPYEISYDYRILDKTKEIIKIEWIKR